MHYSIQMIEQKLGNAKMYCSYLGSGCGSVGRAVTSNSRGQRFESSHRQKFIMNIYCQLNKKTKIKKKRPGMAHFSDNLLQLPTHTCACKGLRHLSEANFSPCEKNTFYSDLSKRKEGGMINSSPGTNTINPFWPYCNCLKNTAIFDALF